MLNPQHFEEAKVVLIAVLEEHIVFVNQSYKIKTFKKMQEEAKARRAQPSKNLLNGKRSTIR